MKHQISKKNSEIWCCGKTQTETKPIFGIVYYNKLKIKKKVANKFLKRNSSETWFKIASPYYATVSLIIAALTTNPLG